MNELSDTGKEGVKQVGQIIKEIINRLNNQPAFLFGIASMVLAVVAFIVLAGFTPSNQAMNWFPYALLFFGLTLILFSYFRSEWLAEYERKQAQLNSIQKSISALSGNVTVIEATQAMDYLSQRFGEAQKTIKQAALAPSLDSNSYANYDKKLNQVLKTKKNIKYLHVVTLDKIRWKRVNEKISDPSVQNYFVKYYDLPDIISSLFLSYAILDDYELVVRYPYMPHQSGMWLSIKNPDIVNLFVRYFDNLWEKGQSLEKDNLQLLQKLNEMYSQ